MCNSIVWVPLNGHVRVMKAVSGIFPRHCFRYSLAFSKFAESEREARRDQCRPGDAIAYGHWDQILDENITHRQRSTS